MSTRHLARYVVFAPARDAQQGWYDVLCIDGKVLGESTSPEVLSFHLLETARSRAREEYDREDVELFPHVVDLFTGEIVYGYADMAQEDR